MICHLQAEKPGKVVMEFSPGLITGKQGYLRLKARESGAPVLKGRRRLDITAQAEKEFYFLHLLLFRLLKDQIMLLKLRRAICLLNSPIQVLISFFIDTL